MTSSAPRAFEPLQVAADEFPPDLVPADVEVDQSTEIRRMMQMLIARGVMPDVP